MDLFDTDNRMRKVKKPSLSNKAELKKITVQKYRDSICFDAIKDLPKNDEVMSYVSMGLSDAGSFLNSVYEINGAIKEAVICSWTISKINIDRILDFLDSGKIQKLHFLMNDGLLKTNSTKPIYAKLRMEFDKRTDKVSYAVANSHAKIQLYHFENGNFVTISGSGNWTENPRIENYILIGGEKTYNFNANWIKEVING